MFVPDLPVSTMPGLVFSAVFMVVMARWSLGKVRGVLRDTKGEIATLEGVVADLAAELDAEIAVLESTGTTDISGRVVSVGDLVVYPSGVGVVSGTDGRSVSVDDVSGIKVIVDHRQVLTVETVAAPGCDRIGDLMLSALDGQRCGVVRVGRTWALDSAVVGDQDHPGDGDRWVIGSVPGM